MSETPQTTVNDGLPDPVKAADAVYSRTRALTQWAAPVAITLAGVTLSISAVQSGDYDLVLTMIGLWIPLIALQVLYALAGSRRVTPTTQARLYLGAMFAMLPAALFGGVALALMDNKLTPLVSIATSTLLAAMALGMHRSSVRDRESLSLLEAKTEQAARVLAWRSGPEAVARVATECLGSNEALVHVIVSTPDDPARRGDVTLDVVMRPRFRGFWPTAAAHALLRRDIQAEIDA